MATPPSWGPSTMVLTEHIDVVLAKKIGVDVLIAEEWMPLQPVESMWFFADVIEIASTHAMTRRRRRRISDALGARIKVTRVQHREFRQTLLMVFGETIASNAAESLYLTNAVASARQVVTRGQAVGVAIVAGLLVWTFILAPATAFAVVIASAGLVFLISTAFKFTVALRGARQDVIEYVSRAEILESLSDDLPVYTVLVPVYREANIVPQLVGNLGEIDYPKDKLEVLILVESDDHETRDAILGANPPDHFHIITVPEGAPRTKPRACNVGLQFARGEFLVIFDAEDIPEPDQLKKAVVAFRNNDPKTAVLQASLNYFNAEENVLTRLFTLEYNYWFYYMLPGLEALGLPIPLGGTSNHFRTRVLRELGGWDPYNVTEDADLGIRAAALGYRVGVINSTTMEEANTSVPNFLRQRSRWVKGYMQTALVHARRPMVLIRDIGLVRFSAFLMLIAGTPATFLLYIPFILLTALAIAFPDVYNTLNIPQWIVVLGIVNLVAGSVLMVHLTMMGPYRRGTFLLVPWALLNPLYWVLHSLASYKALWQLLAKPHYWEKTEHGLTRQAVDD